MPEPSSILIGMGFRHALTHWILHTPPPHLACLEITAEHFYKNPLPLLTTLSQAYPVFIHGLGLSLGTPGPLDPDNLRAFRSVVSLANPRWISDHIAFTHSAGIDFGHLNPIPRTPQTLQTLVDHAREICDLCQKPLILENITSSLDPGGTLSEIEFLHQLCDRAQIGLLLDVTNLYINSQNHGYCPRQWLAQLHPCPIRQLHIVGYTPSQVAPRGNESPDLHDLHEHPIQPELLDLTRFLLDQFPVEAIILERDERLHEREELASELLRLHQLANRDS